MGGRIAALEIFREGAADQVTIVGTHGAGLRAAARSGTPAVTGESSARMRSSFSWRSPAAAFLIACLLNDFGSGALEKRPVVQPSPQPVPLFRQFLQLTPDPFRLLRTIHDAGKRDVQFEVADHAADRLRIRLRRAVGERESLRGRPGA